MSDRWGNTRLPTGLTTTTLLIHVMLFCVSWSWRGSGHTTKETHQSWCIVGMWGSTMLLKYYIINLIWFNFIYETCHAINEIMIHSIHICKGKWVQTGICCLVNSVWPSDTIWRQRSGSTLAQVMDCCLTAPSHYLNQYWLMIISEVHISVISQEMPQPLITKICLKITCLKFHSNFPGAMS